MLKNIKYKILLPVTAVFLVAIFVSMAYAGLDDRIENFFDPKPLPIDLTYNPASISGTYDIDQLVINDADGNPILDSDNDYAVYEDRGEMSIHLNLANGAIDMAFKMQMSGPAFAKGSFLAPYSFIYENKSIRIPVEGQNFAEKLSQIGIHVYEHDKIVWEIPFEGTKTIILILDKESDKMKKITGSKYLFL